MASTPVIPPQQNGTHCATCHDEGMVYRFELNVEHTVTRHEYDEQGELVTEEYEAVTRLGGIDACPACVAKAEVTFSDHSKALIENQEPAKLRVIK